jgi:hypothetical protein
MTNLLADIIIAPKEGFKGFGPLGLESKNPGDAPDIFTKFISNLIGIMTLIAIIYFLIIIVIGAYDIMTAGGDKGKLDSARKKLLTAVVGLVVVISAVFLLDLVGVLLGIPNIRMLSNFISTLGGI